MKEHGMKMPKSAFALYTKLYCRRKSANKKTKQNILMEATKAWVSLSKSDKQIFYKLFEDYEAKLKRNFASNLQNAQPYMRKKPDNILRLKIVTDNDYDKEECNEQDVVNSITLTNTHPEISVLDTSIKDINDKKNHIDQFENCNTSIPIQHTAEPISKLISEPTPPVRSSNELFEVIKNSQDNMQIDKWTDLSKAQKQRYQRALSTIKIEYIKQYTTYLQQLPHKELFEHYKSKF